MSAQQDPVRPDDARGGPGPSRALNLPPGIKPPPARNEIPGAVSSQDGSRRAFRLPGPLIVWWVWVLFTVANLIDIAVTGGDRNSLLAVAAFAVVTGLVYLVTWRPRVIADDHGITVQNPLRDHRIPWGAVNAVVVGESVQVRCSRGPGTSGEKAVHSWALAAPSRRTRLKVLGRGQSRSMFMAPAQSSYAKLPKDAQELMTKSPVYQIAADLDRQARQARDRGAAAGDRVSSWPWRSFATVLIPAAALVIVLLAR